MRPEGEGVDGGEGTGQETPGPERPRGGGGQPGSLGVWAAIREADRREGETVGPFRSWTWLYGTVVVYGILVIGLLMVLTRVLDPASGP